MAFFISSNAMSHTLNNHFDEYLLQNRPSGLSLILKMSDVHVLPEYEDVPHESDNEMILRAEPGTYGHKLQGMLLEVMQSFCR